MHRGADNVVWVAGLGPGRRATLTVEALDALRAASRLYLHTARHPILDELRGDLRHDCRIVAIDEAATVDGIVRTLLTAAGEGPLVYAVDGHPREHESVRLLVAGAAERGVEVHLVAGLSRLDGMAGALPLDAYAHGVQVVDAAGLAALDAFDDRDGDAARGLAELWAGSSSRLLNAQMPLFVAGIHDAHSLATIARRLLERYPPVHEITLLRAAGTAGQAAETLLLRDLAGATGVRGVTGVEGGVEPIPITGAALYLYVYVPPLAPLDDARAANTLGYITARLRGPGGCPWDREQTHTSLTTYMIEEAYEAVDAIERADDVDMVEELGDVLLQVVLHSQLAEEEGRFSLADVAEEVNRKLVRRHPHVFGDVIVDNSSEVLRNWERIKRVEKGERRQSALDGVPLALPALALAQTIGRKAAKHGFDWPNVQGTLAKAREELDELHHAANVEERRDEMGDLLFALTSACRHLGIDAEDALRAAVRKFSGRFRRVEATATERSLDLAAMSPAALDTLWEEAKAQAQA